ncbi:hypothetical protein CRI94_12575 [Longibacter salinarum]|uniref:Lasso RiPP family leader peptide-containing protein n=1 Tax=Longibacter salinarum TaxID=1850348 RepID=A0A2A8CW41_9BACT|nr:lasso RiPP family leader peptide-containing protein [Longibacter salinarum]PEN12833.1 hypothetical protein CRI94_12575 [Longibacter salinarum]
MDNKKSKSYEPPRLSELGRVEDITAAGQNGYCLDDSFQAGTPFDDLTFSVCS